MRTLLTILMTTMMLLTVFFAIVPVAPLALSSCRPVPGTTPRAPGPRPPRTAERF